MSVPEARGNGLSAEAYAALADLHPRVASEMLTALREAGIAAYATPKSDLIDSMVAEGRPDTPAVSDRLYVDASMKARAEQILASRLPRSGDGFAGESAADTDPAGPSGPGAPAAPAAPDGAAGGDSSADPSARDEETIWAEIVAAYDMDTASGTAAPPWPEEEDLPRSPDKSDELDDSVKEDSGQDRSGRLPTARVIKPADAEETEGDDEGHFVPPPPPPLPSADPTTKLAWAALFGGPLYLLISAVLKWQVPGWVAFLAVAAFVGGFVTLVLRMGDDPRDPDDGAVV
ncbi:MAG TPA: hypothetical protein VFU43_22940 [Streptosporangiaceae bacterium]|nr:hypothetical protein [Streptosporangiaceae bacterium]